MLASSLIDENEQIINRLESGMTVTKFFAKRKSETIFLKILRETRQLLWRSLITGQKTSIECLGIREVKEIRIGKNSKDFSFEDTGHTENSKCFVIVCGSEFKLKTHSFAAVSESDCSVWVKGLKYLVTDTNDAPYTLQLERWLRREFYTMNNLYKTFWHWNPSFISGVPLKEIKAFFPRTNYKISNSKLQKIFEEVNDQKHSVFYFDDFSTLYYKLALSENNIHSLFDKYAIYSKDNKTVTFEELKTFLCQEQNDHPVASNDSELVNFIFKYLTNPQRYVKKPYFTTVEFTDFLFSKENDLWDNSKDTVYQDMNRPLSHYWIASSHNTYLTGDQFSSESSTEAYVRCLRWGCRCIELDCWDGPDDTPNVYHGRTLTSTISFLDVIKTIKEHAFDTSNYPVILSLEDNCSIPQQKKMAQMMQEVFGDMLLTSPIDKNEKCLPSPLQLQNKIILKHKKLPEGQDENLTLEKHDDTKEMDLRNTIKNGIMYLEDPFHKEWKPHFFVLTHNKLIYADAPESYSTIQASKSSQTIQEIYTDKDEEDECNLSWLCYDNLEDRQNFLGKKCHERETWYHPHLTRNQAEEILQKIPENGAFLVRLSNGSNSFSISFRAGNKVKHLLVPMDGRLFFDSDIQFETLFELIDYYKEHPLYKDITLNTPVSEDIILKIRKGNITADTTNSFNTSQKITAIAIVDYRAEQDDDLSFCVNAKITNVNCVSKSWWKGDFGGRLQHWFPARHVRIIETQNIDDDDDPSNDSMLLGSLQKGSVDINDAAVSLCINNKAGLEWLLRIENGTMSTPFEAAVQSEYEALDWKTCIEETISSATARESQNRNIEIAWRVAKEISDLIIYCRSVSFSIEKAQRDPPVFQEMSSFSETKAEKLICQQENKLFLKYHRSQFSRVYPKGQRLDSSNYDPINLWNSGCQMIALNYQTADKPMQLNQAKFRDNGRCGYLLKPDFMFTDEFDPYDKNTLRNVDSLTVSIRVIGARHLFRKSRRGAANPFVEIEVVGAEFDRGVKLTTKTASENGLIPIWNDVCEFDIANPSFAHLRFIVQNEDVFGDPCFLGQATYPVTCIRTGYRSIALKNGFSEDLELASLLVYVTIKKLTTNK